MHHNRLPHLPLQLAIVISLLAPQAFSQQWTRFRGPNGSGISQAKSVPIKWTEADYNWVSRLPGRGHSSPVVWGDKLFLTSCDEESKTRFLLCIDTLDGSIAWQRDFKFVTYKKHKNNSYASSTPTVDAEAVYVVWHSKQSSRLLAFGHNGLKIWEYGLGPYLHGQGGATSPIVYDELVILANDQKQPSFLLALDRMTGKPRWKIPRQGKRACYSTPCIFAVADRPVEIIFSHCYEGIVAIDPRSGEQNWQIDVFGRESQRALASPVLADDLIIATSGGVAGEKQLVAIKPPNSGESHEAAEVYRTNRQAPHVPTPIVFRDWLFMWSDQGIVSCLEKATGRVVWQKRIGGNYFSSPVCIDGKIYAVDLDGNVVVIAADDKFQMLARNPLGQPTKATPAVSGGTLFVRTESQLFSIGGPKLLEAKK